MTTDGVFLAAPTDPHAELRRQLLDSGRVLPPPDGPTVTGRADDFLMSVAPPLLADLAGRGLGVAQLDRPLDGHTFLALGVKLGQAMAETDPAVQPYVDNRVILNLINEYEETDDANLAPFSGNYLTLHSEGSGRPLVQQPRYIVLMCCEPGPPNCTQTVLVPMDQVARRLPPHRLTLLSQVRYRGGEQRPTIARTIDDRYAFSFRDSSDDALEWEADRAGDVNGALRDLLTAMYQPDSVAGVHWARGLLVIIDNTFFFHGRTAGGPIGATQRRHLKRLRIVA